MDLLEEIVKIVEHVDNVLIWQVRCSGGLGSEHSGDRVFVQVDARRIRRNAVEPSSLRRQVVDGVWIAIHVTDQFADQATYAVCVESDGRGEFHGVLCVG